MASFDIVSQVDRQEVRNAVDQSMRELISRYDFKGTDSSFTRDGDAITLKSESEFQLKQMLDMLQGKLNIELDGEIVDVLREGDTVGELNLVCQRPSGVTVVAAKPCTLLAIPRRGFRKLLHRRPWMGVVLLEELFRLSCKRGIAWS